MSTANDEHSDVFLHLRHMSVVTGMPNSKTKASSTSMITANVTQTNGMDVKHDKRKCGLLGA
jgi:hypothetical protein